MFTVHCPHHGREILLDHGRIRGLDTTPDGIVLRWECWCGHVGTTLTGRAATATAAAPAPRPASPVPAATAPVAA
jgi:hypothetical protein